MIFKNRNKKSKKVHVYQIGKLSVSRNERTKKDIDKVLAKTNKKLRDLGIY